MVPMNIIITTSYIKTKLHNEKQAIKANVIKLRKQTNKIRRTP